MPKRNIKLFCYIWSKCRDSLTLLLCISIENQFSSEILDEINSEKSIKEGLN